MDGFPGMDKDGLIEYNGTVEHIVFQNDENGYCVCELGCEDEYITAVGVMPFIAEGETVRVLGKWELHATFGRQFKVEMFEKQLPENETSMLKYLSSGAIRGIGSVTAGRIVEKFGKETFDVLENHCEWLSDIQGISPKKAKAIGESFRAQFGIRSLMMFCRDYFGPATAMKVYKKWGGAAVDCIKENPYCLCDGIAGIGFRGADRIATALGFDAASPQRLRAGISFILNSNARENGHVFIPEDKLTLLAAEELQSDREVISELIETMITSGILVRCVYDGRRCIYTAEYYKAEKYIADKLILLDRMCSRIPVDDIDRFIQQTEIEFDITYAAMQKKAISSAVNSGVMALTGGPGTGKTTVIRAVLCLFERMGLRIALAAPTGRAAKRMSEATGREAKTIHRMLEMEYSDEDIPRFRRCERELLEEDAIIIDETSMVDTPLMSALLRAVKPGARLILIGDADQLPSVGPGNVFADILSSDCFESVRLKEIFRQASESLIVTNAHAINSGEYPELEARSGDFFLVRRQTEEEVATAVAGLYAHRLPKTYGEGIRNMIQVITPSHKGAAGTEYLNQLLQRELNPPSPSKREKKHRERIFREGDRVMQIKNNYDITWEKEGTDGVGIFNGDIGTLIRIKPSEECLVISFDERIAEYDYTLLDELEHAYAITVHKSQGSEYPTVIMPVCGSSPRLMTRNLLYTAVTRAQEMAILVGRPDTVCAMVDNNRHDKRYTGLGFMLEQNRP